MPSNSNLPSLHQREEEEEKEDEEEEDEEEESCPVCFIEFDTCLHPPSTLPCGHIFCLPCLLHPSLASRGHIHCPLCRQPSSRPQTTHTTTHLLNANTQLWTAPRVISAPSVSQPPVQMPQRSEFNIRPARRFPSHPAGVSVVISEGWLEGRCALCCRLLSPGPFPLHCGHFLCHRCLGLLLALASPGWVSFLYCPQCQGQTSVDRGHTSHHTPTVPTITTVPTSNNPPNTPSSSSSTSSPPSPVPHPSTPSLSPQASVPLRGGRDGQERGNGGCGCGGRALCILM